MAQSNTAELKVQYVQISSLKPSLYNPRKWSKDQLGALKESITRFGVVDPVLANCAAGRENILIGGHMRLAALKELGHTEVPVVFLNIADAEKEKELNVRLNKNLGEFDFAALKTFGENILKDIGFSSEELDSIFEIESTPEQFDLAKELQKAGVKEVLAQKGDVFEIDGSRLMVGDSTSEEDMLALMSGVKADFCFTDPPYLLNYLKGKTKQKDGVTRGFGAKKNRVYLGTESLPENFTDLWMSNVAKVVKPDFSIMVFENPKNLRTIWNAIEAQGWCYRSTVVWHIPNRVQGFSMQNKFYNKHDVALVGTGGDVVPNDEEEPLFQEEYENALYATSGKAHWEGYEKGKKYQPTDFIEHVADDKKASGQGVIFGTKPLEILIPYIKFLTKRDGLVLEPFGGSGSTLIASIKMGRVCRIMEKSPEYAEVIKARWERVTGKVAKKIN